MTANETAYDMHKAGYSLNDIARHLNKEGYQRPFGARWDETAVQSAVVERVEELKQGKITKWRPDEKSEEYGSSDPLWINEKMLREAVSDYAKYGCSRPRRWNAKWGELTYSTLSTIEANKLAQEYKRCRKENEAVIERMRKAMRAERGFEAGCTRTGFDIFC